MASKADSYLSLGERGEMIGWGYLVRNGFKILEKNYRCTLGEIDVIAEKGKRLFFIEIKTRAQSKFGLPQEAVHESKQHRIIRVAEWYLKEKQKGEPHSAFCVLAITMKNPAEPEIVLIENAFEVPDLREAR